MAVVRTRIYWIQRHPSFSATQPIEAGPNDVPRKVVNVKRLMTGPVGGITFSSREENVEIVLYLYLLRGTGRLLFPRPAWNRSNMRDRR